MIDWVVKVLSVGAGRPGTVLEQQHSVLSADTSSDSPASHSIDARRVRSKIEGG
ncbi:hypothetical protein [Nocardia sp. Root136]|uniref:hypothetical protein n=1 Tax=Nocardia sp. Root136 TaxID=1736458 RepID=UPI000A481193|nr:hypothetical protein [Nocardia sp. Root136]